jgi:hypothetical protein
MLLVLCVLGLASSSLAGSASRLPGFRSPSGNIKCLFVPGPPAFMLCKIAQADYGRKLVAYCGSPQIGVDWAGFTLGVTRKGSVSCSGGVLYPGSRHPSYVTLPYGKTWTHGVFTCWSRVTGVTCRNHTGHGLFVSRRSWRAW